MINWYNKFKYAQQMEMNFDKALDYYGISNEKRQNLKKEAIDRLRNISLSLVK